MLRPIFYCGFQVDAGLSCYVNMKDVKTVFRHAESDYIMFRTSPYPVAAQMRRGGFWACINGS